MGGAARPSMQERIRRRRRGGFVGRREELGLFRGNFDIPPDDDRHRFVFHVRGNAGVGKTSLMRELEEAARERGALTAYTDEAVAGVPEVMAAVSEQFGRQGRPLKALDRALATYRQRQFEAESAAVQAGLSAGPQVGLSAGPSVGLQAGAQPGPSAGLQAGAGAGADGPSAGSRALATAGLAGLGMVPGIGAFAAMADPGQVAEGADRLRAALSARLRSQEDVRLVLSPLQVLTPVLVSEIRRAGAEVPWIALFFDTYERTAPFLDEWLRDLITTERYGALPDHVVITLAGQRGLDPGHWGDYADVVTDLPLGPFTESEARRLLADKGVVDEPVVREVLRLSGRLPVLVSTLAAGRPDGPGDLDDPSATAVERFLKWERDPARRAVALACALPRGLNEDILRWAVGGRSAGVGAGSDSGAGVDTGAGSGAGASSGADTEGTAGRSDGQGTTGTAGLAGAAGFAGTVGLAAIVGEEEAAGLFGWLCTLPFVSGRSGGRARYHDVVRDPMLRLQRTASPRRWTEAHTRLAEAFARERAAAEDGLEPHLGIGADQRWAEESWRGPRLEESYHLLCARPRAALPAVLRDGIAACRLGPVAARRWARTLADAGRDSGSEQLGAWGAECLGALGDERRYAIDVLGLLLVRPELTEADRTAAYTARGWNHFRADAHEEALADYGRAVALDPAHVPAYHGRALTLRALDDFTGALADLDRAEELAPGTAWVPRERGETYRRAGRYEEAVAELDRAHARDPHDPVILGSRGQVKFQQGEEREALQDLDRAIELWSDYTWALRRRAHVRGRLGDTAGALADLGRAERLDPELAQVPGQRGEVYRWAGRYEEAVTEFTRALALDPSYTWALGSRAMALKSLGRTPEALADLNRALELRPAYDWARARRDELLAEQDASAGPDDDPGATAPGRADA
ncbi:tetratricopeptide repeat protein [Streptomyces sp. GMY02]|uniref:tetratricopeptide repeat protein n=1 Tax=Streptomyces sp. GMY02 TaxID=1333528 RepID=UPI001C2C4D95|nr:tetratricopeptide repeat protein [Streptomyces sp. GMY02]QXE36362.1 tetratricopeptide repeat protein [Streptomyces sp. GMY02]